MSSSHFTISHAFPFGNTSSSLERIGILLCAFAFLGPLVAAQQLARRSFIGITLEKKGSSFFVTDVAPQSSAQQAGVLQGDVLLRIGNVPIQGPQSLDIAARRYRSGSRLTFLVLRSGHHFTKGTLALPFPPENRSNADVLYMSVSVDGYLHRMIVTKPRTPGLYPAVFLIGGLGCYSLDNLSPDGTGYGWIIDGFAQAGFVTVRIEKSGEGDSEGPPCTSKVASLKLAADRSIAGINKTATLPFVNAEKIFILAHSVGPVEGALAISKVHVAGFVASETVGTSWFEYTVETARHQQLLLGATYDDVEHEARLTDKCIFFLEVAKESPRRIIRSHPECASYIPVQGGAPYTYFQDLADVNLPTEWKQANVPVLVTYGSSDPLTSSAQSHYLVELVNSFHPGNAEYLLIEGMSHHFDQQPSEASALQALLTGHDGPYLPEFLDRVLEWIRNVK